MKIKKYNSYIISYNNLRVGLGFIGLLLPIVLIFGAFVFGSCSQIQSSISHYYYTVMGNFFVGALCAIAVFLFFYNGYDVIDNIVAKVAATAALFVAFFPPNPDVNAICSIVNIKLAAGSNIIHFVAAGLLFLCFAYFSLFLFTKTSDDVVLTYNKGKRNIIYKNCGIVILSCLFLMGVYSIWGGLQTSIGKYKPVLLLESLALFAFGLSWVTKGDMVMRDGGER
jgi:hypothetical protein